MSLSPPGARCRGDTHGLGWRGDKGRAHPPRQCCPGELPGTHGCCTHRGGGGGAHWSSLETATGQGEGPTRHSSAAPSLPQPRPQGHWRGHRGTCIGDTGPQAGGTRWRCWVGDATGSLSSPTPRPCRSRLGWAKPLGVRAVPRRGHGDGVRERRRHLASAALETSGWGGRRGAELFMDMGHGTAGGRRLPRRLIPSKS